MKRILPIVLALAAGANAEVKVTVGEVNDRRSTGEFFNSLEVQLMLAGPELAECKGIRLVLKDAADDTGKALEPKKTGIDDKSFRPPEKPFGSFRSGEKKPDEYELKLQFANPARAAKTIKALNGTIEILLPAKDPASVITASVGKDAGSPLPHEGLKSSGIELALLPYKDNQLGYTIKDPNSKVAAVEFCGADGKPLKTQGTMSSKFGSGPRTVQVSFESAPPADAVVKIYLITDKSVSSVPVALTGIPLP